MSSSVKSLLAALALAAAGGALAQTAYPGIGRAATPKEIQAWDIDVRPDFKGLPAGKGSVDQGTELWEARCASCHGVFGESNEVFSPLIGGTTADDIKTGRVARLNDRGFPGRTTLMKVPTVSTLWDYIYRAMPWNAPKSLKPDEVYAVLAYLLNLAEVVPADYLLSDKNIAEVQQRMPNRNGMTTEHHLWPGKGMGGKAPDVKSVACMKDCAGEPDVASFLPDFARNAHGNLAEQNRMVGAQLGADTTKPAGTPPTPVAPPAAPAAPKAGSAAGAPTALLAQRACTACHGMDTKIVGPGFAEIARKYAGRADREAYLAGKIVSGGSGVWGAIPMPPQTLPAEEVKVIAAWLAAGAAK
jgi:S-disulfanyl-L-cysteine oxidoreductase SoxD